MGADAAPTVVRAQELVIGLQVGNESRAYPINMLCRPTREIVTDEVGGERVAITWCHLCHNALVFLARNDGKDVTLRVSGMLWKHNLVMQDLETRSLWSHMLGECMAGELKGARLTMLPCASDNLGGLAPAPSRDQLPRAESHV